MNGASPSLLRALRGPIMMTVLGSLLALDHFTQYSFGRTWPVLLIVMGLMTLAERMARPQSPMGGN